MKGKAVNRPLLAPLAGLALALLLAAGALVAWTQLSRTALAPASDRVLAVPLAADKTLGVNADLSGLNTAGREAALASMEAAGFRWLRQRFPWDAIEPERSAYDWAIWDEIVEGASRHKLVLIAVLDRSPAWARAGEDVENALAPPAETRDYGAFVQAFANRYRDLIDYYQVWDEPNISPHWGARWVDPGAYSRLLREGAIQVRAADPGATVLAAALAPNAEPGGANMSDVQFLDALYHSGAAEWFDAVAVQPYDFGQPLIAPPDPNQLNWARVTLLRDVVDDHGDSSTAMWAVSFGRQGASAQTGGVERALALSEAVQDARERWPWMGPMLWAAWSPQDAHSQYALTGPGIDTAPFGALERLAKAPATAWPGSYQANHPSGRYEGNWRVHGSGADIGQSGDRLAIRFWGTRLDLTVRRGDYRAFLFVSVDGQPGTALPRDQRGRAYVVLYDPLHAQEAVTLARGLPEGEHEATIVAERGWGQWAIVGWTVSREVPRRSRWLPPALLLAALVVFGISAWRSWTLRHLLLDPRRLSSQRRQSLKRSGVGSGVAGLLLRYRALDDRLALGITAAATLLLFVTVGTLPSLLALGILAGLLILRPETGLPLIALALPFYQPGKPLMGKVFSTVEILTVLTTLGWAINRVLAVMRRSPASPFAAARRAADGAQDTAEGVPFRCASGIVNLRGPSVGPQAWMSSARNACSRLASYASRLTSLDWGVVALLVVGAASLLWAENGRVAAREFRTVILEACLFYALLRLTVRDRPSLRSMIIPEAQRRGTASSVWRIADAWMLGGLAIALVGVYQWAFGQNLITAEGVWRVRGFYGSPNNLALYLGRLLPVAIAIAAWGRRGGRRWFYGLTALVMAVALVLTYSRGAWLLGVPVSLLFLMALRGRRAFVLALGVLLLAAVVLLLVVGPGRLTSLLDTTGGTTFFRLQLWQSSWSMVRDHPVLGVGLDNFLYEYRTRYVLPSAWEEFNLSHPHNLVLDFWLRLGLPGLAVLAWLLVAFFRRGWQAACRLAGGDRRWLVLGLMAGMVDFVAHGLVDNAFFLVDLGFAFMLMAALVQAVHADEGPLKDGQ